MTNPVGKPPWIPTPDIIKEAEGYASLGLMEYQIADCLGIGVSTLCEKKNSYPELADAIKRGKSKGIARAANKLVKMGEKGNVTALIFYLKCVGKWKEQEAEETISKDLTEIGTARIEYQRDY